MEDSAWDRRVAQRVVHYLLVKRGSPVPDDMLLEAFWPGTPQESARRSLKVAVSCARAVLDAPDSDERDRLGAGHPRVPAARRRLRRRGPVRARGAAGLAAQGAERRELLERAAGLWTGEPLPEERYAEWTIAWRET